MANPKDKTTTRKGLFGRTITKTKVKNENGSYGKSRTVTRSTKEGLKTKTRERVSNPESGYFRKTKSKSLTTPSPSGNVTSMTTREKLRENKNSPMTKTKFSGYVNPKAKATIKRIENKVRKG